MKQRPFYWAATKKLHADYDLRPHGPIRASIKRQDEGHRVTLWDSRKTGAMIVSSQLCDTLDEAKAVGITRVRLERST